MSLGLSASCVGGKVGPDFAREGEDQIANGASLSGQAGARHAKNLHGSIIFSVPWLAVLRRMNFDDQCASLGNLLLSNKVAGPLNVTELQ